MKKIGIFGGTFDPIHNGHLYIAYEAKKQLGLDKIIFVPSGTPPHKNVTNVTEADIRFKMVSMAISHYEYFDIDDYEIKKEGRSYTCETLKHYKDTYDDTKLYFIVGADSLINIDTWKNVNEIVSYSTLTVFKRPGFSVDKILKKKEELKERYNHNVIFFDTLDLDISSTDIKQRIKNNERVDFFMERDILEFIKKRNLYK